MSLEAYIEHMERCGVSRQTVLRGLRGFAQEIWHKGSSTAHSHTEQEEVRKWALETMLECDRVGCDDVIQDMLRLEQERLEEPEEDTWH